MDPDGCVWWSACNNCLSHMHNGPIVCMENSLVKESTRKFFIFIFIYIETKQIHPLRMMPPLLSYFMALHILYPFALLLDVAVVAVAVSFFLFRFVRLNIVVLLLLAMMYICVCMCVYELSLSVMLQIGPSMPTNWNDRKKSKRKKKPTQESSVGDFLLYISVNK